MQPLQIFAMEPFGFSRAANDMQSKYNVCKKLKIGMKCEQLIRLLPNNSRAAQILQNIDDTAHNTQAMDPIADADEVVTGLLQCASYAVSAVYNAPAKPNTTTKLAPKGLFTALNNYAISNLNCSPVPPLLHMLPTTYRAARNNVSVRDSVSAHPHSGPHCAFTGMVRAQATHIIPVDTAGGVSRGRWFWLWLTIILPPEELNLAWEACGGRSNNSISNVIMLCHPLRELYDAMSISFRPIDIDTPHEGYSLIIETNLGSMPLHGLYDHNQNPLDIGKPVYWQPRTKEGVLAHPAPFLFAVHGYFCQIRLIMSGTSPPRPAPEIPDISRFVQEWDAIAAAARTSAVATPASSVATSSSGTSDYPRPSLAVLRAALESRLANYDGAEEFYAEDSDEE